MDLHPPGGPVRSVKDFFVHISVVTLGILIALGLEQLVESHHRANLAASWDTAIATQALNELPFEAVTRYAQAHGTLRLFDETERQGLIVWQSVRRLGSDPAVLTQGQRTTLIQELRRYSNALIAIDFAAHGALKSCDDALTAAK